MGIIDLTGWKQTFSDEFDQGFYWDNGTSGWWKTEYGFEDLAHGNRYSFNNGEAQYYMDRGHRGFAASPVGIDPFQVRNGILTIEAKPTPPEVRPFVNGQPYTSGLMTTQDSFAQLYGYFEMRAKLPVGQGLWPAFWLVSKQGAPNAEIDIMEVLGRNTSELHMNTVRDGIYDDKTRYNKSAAVADTSKDFHLFGVEWNESNIIWYFDRQEVGRFATPDDFKRPMYILANMAVGGSWGGYPDATTAFPAKMEIDYIRAYSHDPDALQLKRSDPLHLPASAPALQTVTGKAGGDTLNGTAGNDLLDGRQGADTMIGGRGDDTYAVENAADRVVEQSGKGTDTVRSAVGYTLPDHVENLVLLGSAPLRATGKAGDNIIVGNAGANLIDGAGGNDLLTGGGGRDTFIVRQGSGNVTITDFASGPGAGDVVKLEAEGFVDFAYVRGAMTQNNDRVELAVGGGNTLTFLHRTIEQFAPDDFALRRALPTTQKPTNWIDGTEGNDTIAGTARNDQIFGKGGQDRLAGAAGDDTYIPQSQADLVVERPNEGIDLVRTWAHSYALPDNVENLTLENVWAVEGIGNALDNRIIGSAGANRLDGRGGNDLLTGGDGNDTFVVARDQGSDTITDFHPGTGAGDVVELRDFAFTDFGALRNAMTQSGSDVILRLSPTQTLTFEDTKIAQFAADDIKLIALALPHSADLH